MSIAEWIALISVILVLIGLLGTSNSRINKSIQDSEFRSQQKIEEIVKQHEEKYVEVKVCKIIESNSEEKYQALTKKVDEICSDQKKIMAKLGIS